MELELTKYISLSSVMFLEYGIWGAWAPVLAARLLGPLKMSGKQTSWIYATLPLACIVSPLISGQLADQWFNTEWILVIAHLSGAVFIFLAAKQEKFLPLFITMLLYSLCYAATLPLANAVLFASTSDVATQGKIFIWAPIGWGLVGYALSGWRMTRKTEGDGSDCLYFAAGLSVLMAMVSLTLPATPPAGTGEIPILQAMQMLSDINFLTFIILSMIVMGLMQFYFLGTAQYLQEKGISSKHVPGSMAIAQVGQTIATWFWLGLVLGTLGFRWSFTLGVACWIVMYGIYVVGKPRALLVVSQALHGFAYLFFVVVGQIFAETIAPVAIRSSMQALVFAATIGIGLLIGTQVAGLTMDRLSQNGVFHWQRLWLVPTSVLTICILVLIFVFQAPV
jgi:nucleoside transporter